LISCFASASTFLSRHRAGEIFLVPPTFITLSELDNLGKDAFNSVRSGAVIEPTLIKTMDSTLCVALPGDFEHYQFAGAGAPMRRLVVKPGGFQWIDTVGGTKTPTSSL
jgi:hypothetical protein